MNDAPIPHMPPMLAAAVTREPKTNAEKKMHAMRLSQVLQELHMTAHDGSIGEEEGKIAAATMAMTMLKNFELLVWALRSAGGAAKP